jgi:hypothetical protein
MQTDKTPCGFCGWCLFNLKWHGRAYLSLCVGYKKETTK